MERGRARKLWEMPEGYPCSIVGTCLTRDDLIKVNRKKDVRGGEFSSFFELHGRCVHWAHYQGPASLAMQRILQKRYQRYLRKFHAISCAEQLRELWTEAKNDGEIAGAYWAISSHPCIDDTLLSEIYGDVHMLSHESVAGLQRSRRENRLLRGQNQKLLDAQKSLRNQQQLRLRKFEEEKRELQAAVRAARDERDRLLLRPVATLSVHPDRGEHIELEELRNDNERLLQALQKQRAKTRDFQGQLLAEQARRSADISCSQCQEQYTSACPGKDLCGKRVLYVGGMHKMVQHYRALIEESGGEFLHHDGGREHAKSRLPMMLSQADAVMCPVDCVSHDACLTVKRLCKRNRKPYVMMRSSGLASLASGLEQLS